MSSLVRQTRRRSVEKLAENIYVDHASGAKASRPQFDIVLRMLTNLRQLALATSDVGLLGWVAPLRASVPGVGDADLRLLDQLRAKLS